MPKKAIIMCGVSGSGKSSHAASLKEAHTGEVVITSADQFMVSPEGGYQFDPRRLDECHDECLRKFMAAIVNGVSLVICDNTNTTLHEISPYLRISQVFGYDTEVLMVLCDPKVAWKRNQHNVGLHVVMRQHLRLQKTLANFPSRWKSTLISTDLEAMPSQGPVDV